MQQWTSISNLVQTTPFWSDFNSLLIYTSMLIQISRHKHESGIEGRQVYAIFVTSSWLPNIIYTSNQLLQSVHSILETQTYINIFEL